MTGFFISRIELKQGKNESLKCSDYLIVGVILEEFLY